MMSRPSGVVKSSDRPRLPSFQPRKPKPKWRKASALEAFDFDYVGAHLSENHRAVGAGDIGAEIEHDDAGERTARGIAPRSRGGGSISIGGVGEPADGIGDAIGRDGGSGAGDRAGGIEKINRHAELNGWAQRRIGDFIAHRKRSGLRMIDELMAREDGRAGDVGRAQQGEPFVARTGADNRFENVFEGLPVLLGDTPRGALKAFVSDQLGVVNCERELVPEGHVTAGDEEIAAVGGLEQAIAGNRAERILRTVIKRGHLFVAHDTAGL
jgi:hypothetical protein